MSEGSAQTEAVWTCYPPPAAVPDSVPIVGAGLGCRGHLDGIGDVEPDRSHAVGAGIALVAARRSIRAARRPDDM
ncbi:hypothetical protein [Streptomyces sp. NPDC002763]|uniref:hypothetical protein n=1 Tax=Streptomyces sp. NPDC002763 TaxID=3154427 RepID=UPI003317597E